MVASAFALVKKGFTDWIVQRVTAVVLFFYFNFILFYWLFNPSLTYADWRSFILAPMMSVAGILAILCIVWHAWIGLWTVLTDYVKLRRLRLSLQLFVILTLIVYLVWGIYLFIGY